METQSVPTAYQLRPGDVVDLTVFQEPDMTSTQRVLGDGTIWVGYLGRVKVAGDTIETASQKLAKALDGKYLIHPQVSIAVASYASRQFTVLGQVLGAGNFDIPGEGVVTLPQALALARGATDLGDLKRVTVNRRIGAKVEKIRVNALAPDAQLFLVKEGDVIVVPEAIF